MAIFAERQNKCLTCATPWNIDQNRITASKVSVLSIELPPIFRREEIPSVNGGWEKQGDGTWQATVVVVGRDGITPPM
jgi:hypothetical protein